MVPSSEFSKEVSGQPFEDHLRANSTFDDGDGKGDPWAAAGPLEAADGAEFPRGKPDRNLRISPGEQPDGTWHANVRMNVHHVGWMTSTFEPSGSRDEAVLRALNDQETTLTDTAKHFADSRPDAEALLAWVRSEKEKLEHGGTLTPETLAAVRADTESRRARVEDVRRRQRGEPPEEIPAETLKNALRPGSMAQARMRRARLDREERQLEDAKSREYDSASA